MNFKSPKLDELVRVYQDLEKTLKGLRKSAEKSAESSLRHIDIKKLIIQLSRSKRRIERKIGNTILLEKQQFKKKLRHLATNLQHREKEA